MVGGDLWQMAVRIFLLCLMGLVMRLIQACFIATVGKMSSPFNLRGYVG